LECSPDRNGYVYFLGTPDGRYIKVGYSGRNDWSRIRTHSKGDAFGLNGNFEVLAVVRGTQQCEAAIHEYFAAHVVPNLPKRETFFSEPLISYVTWLRDKYFVSLTETEFHSESGGKTIEPITWLPGPGRESTRRTEAALPFDAWAFLPTRNITGDDWYTPEQFMDIVREALGGTIDLDPASHVIANRVVQAQRIFTIDQNGLTQPWEGRIWLNPPFSDWPRWADKVLSELDSIEAIVMLGATRTLTAQYFRPLLERSDGFCIITGRTPFWGIKSETTSPTDGHFLLYIGPQLDRFLRLVRPIGVAWRQGGV